MDLTGGAVLEKGCVYVIPLMESLALPAGMTAVALVEPTVSRTLGLISRRGKPLSAAARLLYDMLVAQKTVL